MWTCVRGLGAHLHVARCMFGEVDAGQRHVDVARDYVDGVPSVAGRHRLEDFGQALADELRAGRSFVVIDAWSDAAHGRSARAARRLCRYRRARPDRRAARQGRTAGGAALGAPDAARATGRPTKWRCSNGWPSRPGSPSPTPGPRPRCARAATCWRWRCAAAGWARGRATSRPTTSGGAASSRRSSACRQAASRAPRPGSSPSSIPMIALASSSGRRRDRAPGPTTSSSSGSAMRPAVGAGWMAAGARSTTRTARRCGSMASASTSPNASAADAALAAARAAADADAERLHLAMVGGPARRLELGRRHRPGHVLAARRRDLRPRPGGRQHVGAGARAAAPRRSRSRAPGGRGAIETRGDYAIEYRLVHDGRERWVSARGRAALRRRRPAARHARRGSGRQPRPPARAPRRRGAGPDDGRGHHVDGGADARAAPRRRPLRLRHGGRRRRTRADHRQLHARHRTASSADIASRSVRRARPRACCAPASRGRGRRQRCRRPPDAGRSATRTTAPPFVASSPCRSSRPGGSWPAWRSTHATPRAWQPHEVALVQQVASRCWESIERARVEEDRARCWLANDWPGSRPSSRTAASRSCRRPPRRPTAPRTSSWRCSATSCATRWRRSSRRCS